MIYTPGTQVLISVESVMLSGQTQVNFGGRLPTWGAARHMNWQLDIWHQSLPVGIGKNSIKTSQTIYNLDGGLLHYFSIFAVPWSKF